MGELARVLNEHGADITASPLDAARLAGLIALVEKGTISGSIAKGVFEKMYASGQTAEAIVAAEGLTQIDDESQIVALVADVLARHPGSGSAVSLRQDDDVWISGRPGDEGHRRQGEPKAGQRIAEAGARPAEPRGIVNQLHHN